MKIDIKPLSINQAFQGRRFKTPKYSAYEKEALLKLKPYRLPNAPYLLIIEFGVSSPLADLDNNIKPIQDILAKKYGFNDKLINQIQATKVVVEKGKEYVDFELKSSYL